MNKLILISLVIFFTICSKSWAEAELIANCEGAYGHAYYHYYGITPKDKSGWDKDAISKGKFSFKKVDDDKFDLLFIDASQSITSSIQSGASIFPVIRTDTSMTVLVIYPSVVETYSFWQNKDGEYKFALSQSKTGDILLRKNSLMVGSCSYIDFNY
jgi:hypothetical protein